MLGIIFTLREVQWPAVMRYALCIASLYVQCICTGKDLQRASSSVPGWALCSMKSVCF